MSACPCNQLMLTARLSHTNQGPLLSLCQTSSISIMPLVNPVSARHLGYVLGSSGYLSLLIHSVTKPSSGTVMGRQAFGFDLAFWICF